VGARYVGWSEALIMDDLQYMTRRNNLLSERERAQHDLDRINRRIEELDTEKRVQDRQEMVILMKNTNLAQIK